MIIDKLNVFAEKEDFFGTAGSAQLGEAIDLGAAPTDMGEGYPYYLVGLVTADMAGGTSVRLNLVTADNDALSTNPVTLLSSAVIPVADAVAGVAALKVAIPKADYKRYLGVTVTRVGNSTEGAMTVFLTQDPPNWRPYPEGLN